MKFKIGNKEVEISDEVISKAIEDKTESLSFEGDFQVRTAEEEISFLNNIRKEANTAGLEVAIKATRDKLGLDFQGKNMDSLLKAYETKVLADAKIEPEEKLKKMMSDLEGVKTANQNLITEKDNLNKEFISFRSENKIDNILNSLIPEKTILPKEDMKVLLRTKVKLNVDENGNVIALDSEGNVLKNKTTADPLSAKDVIDDFFKTNQNYLQGVNGGTGGKDSGTPNGTQTIEQFIIEMKEKGINPNSSEFNQIASERQKANILTLD